MKVRATVPVRRWGIGSDGSDTPPCRALVHLGFAGTLLLLAIGCSSTPPSNATPTVAISAPPAAPSAAETTSAPEETTTGTEAEEPAQDCESQIAALKAMDATTLDDCQELARQILFLRQSCDTDGGTSSEDMTVWSLLDSAECMEDVGIKHLALLSKAIPAASATKVKDAQSALKGEISDFCTRDCGRLYTTHCTQGVLACMDSAYETAAAGTLDFGKASKVGKASRVFTDQANALCALPATAWKGGKVTAKCADAALSWLQGCADPSGVCDNP